MATGTHNFTGSHNGYDLTSARAVALSGSYSDAGIVQSVTAYIRLSTTSAAKTATLTAAVVSNGVTYYGTFGLTGSSVWGGEYGGHTFTIGIGSISGFNINAVTSVTISVNQNGSYFFTKGSQSVSVVYTVPTANGAPTAFYIGSSSANPGTYVSAYNEGATAGDAGSISGYRIEYSDNGGAWTEYVASEPGSKNWLLPASSTSGVVRAFRTRALSGLGSSYDSAWTNGNQTVTTNYPSALATPASGSMAATTGNPSTTIRFSWATVANANLNTLSDYLVQTRVHDGANWGAWGNDVAVAAGTLYKDFTLPSTSGYSFQAQVRARGSAGASYYSAYRVSSNYTTVNYPTQLPTPATASFASTTANPSVNTAFNYGTVAGQNLNSLTDYEIQYAESTDGGATWGNWIAGGTSTSGTINIAAGGTWGYVRKAQVRARGSAGTSYYSGWKASTNTLTTNYPSTLAAPATASFAATTANPNAEVTFTYGAVAGVNLNALQTYEFQSCTSTDGTTWSAWVAAGSEDAGITAHTATADATGGKQKKLRVRARGAAGVPYYSAWKESTNILTTNYPTKLSVPSSFAASKTLADPSELISLSWAGATNANLNAVTGYDIDYHDSTDGGTTYGLWVDLTTVNSAELSGSYNTNAPSAYGTTREYRIRVQGAGGSNYYSNFKTSTNTVLSRTPVKITGPNSISLDATTTNPGVATILRWSGVVAGTINSIVKHMVEHSDSDDLAAWSSWSASGNVVSVATSESLSVVSSTTNGRYRKFRVQIQGSAGATYYSDWVESSVMLQATPITQVGAPTNAYVSPTNAEAASQLFFSGATQGVYNTITGYGWQYADSADNSTYGSWSTESTASIIETSGDFAVNVPSTRGHYRKFRIRTKGDAGSQYYSAYYELTTRLQKNTLPTAPTTLGFTPALFEDTVRFTWSGAVGGVGNAIASYTLAYATSDNGTTFSTETVVTGILTAYYDLDTSAIPRAKYVRFRVLTVGVGELSSAYSSYSINARKNSIPSAPTGVTVPTVFDPANETYIVSFTDGGDIDNNIVGYEVAFQYPNGTFYGAPTILHTSSAGAGNSVTVNGSTYTRGVSWLIAIRAYDTLGVRSEWAVSAEVMAINPLQAVPSVVFPLTGKMTYNRRPRIGMKLTGGTAGTNYSVKLTFATVQRGTVGTYSAEFSRTGDTIQTGADILWRLSAEMGTTGVTAQDFLTNDGIADLPAASRPSAKSISVTGLSLTDPTITVNLTQVKAVHINELRTAINTVRDYYSLPVVVWSETLTANSTTIRASHIQEMRTAIDQIITYVNSFDAANSANNIDPITWTDATLLGTVIKKAHIQEIRDAIPNL